MSTGSRCQDFNSKCFLITYLVLVGFLLMIWFNGAQDMAPEEREIPSSLSNFLLSPAKELNLKIDSPDEILALTKAFYSDKWTWAYFSHANCFPACLPSYQKLQHLQSSYASRDIQFIIFDIDDRSHKSNLKTRLNEQGFDFTVIKPNGDNLAKLAQQFQFLFLATDYQDGSYLIEQQETIFLVDPQARVYAQFTDPLTAVNLQKAFIQIRQFYVKSESDLLKKQDNSKLGH